MSHPPPGPNAESGGSPPPTLTVLVIDDQEPMRQFVQEALENSGFRVLAADGGASGIEAARAEIPDVILCDLAMPGLDGHDVLSAMRAHPGTAAIPVIFLTGRDRRADQRRGMEAGADDYLTKPFAVEDLVAAVRTQIQKHASMTDRSQGELDVLRDGITRLLPHELLTPLSPIVGYADMLRTSAADLTVAQLEGIGESIDISAKRLERMIGNILFYADLEILRKEPTEAVAATVRTTSIAEPIRAGALRAVTRAGRQGDLRMTVEDLAVAIPRDHLERVAEELVDNACKFSPDGTGIEVRATRADGQVRLSVADRGRGMTREEIKTVGAYLQFRRKLFEQQGTGLGLIIVKRVAELANGRLSLTSVPGRETLVEVYAPLA